MATSNVPGSMESTAADYRTEAESRHERGMRMLRWIIGFTVLTTVLHYTHNALYIEDYPQDPAIPTEAARVAVIVALPLLTLAGFLGYRAYTARRYWRAYAWLLVYSLSGVGSMGHFLIGVPDLPVFWFATIVTDALSALAIWAFVIWSAAMLGEGSRALKPAR